MTFSDNCTQLTCPHCGEPKYLLALASGNTFDGEVWSDSRQWYPMMLEPSIIQKCPHCSHYYYYYDGNPKAAVMEVWESPMKRIKWRIYRNGARVERPEPEKTPEQLARLEIEQKIQDEASKNRFGYLTLPETDEARKDLIHEESTLDNKKEYLLSYLFAYNDARYGRANTDKGILLEYYHERFREVAKDLIELFGEDKTLTAELWRELGCFEKSIEVCYKLTAAGKDVEVVRQIREHAEARDPNVFLLHFDD